jgi:hypothetical protein
MGKYKLNYSKLGESEINEISFTTLKARANFIADAIIGTSPKVFILDIIHEGKNTDDEGLSSIYVFDWWHTINFVVEQKWPVFYLFEVESYEKGYKLALDLKETSPLCYS